MKRKISVLLVFAMLLSLLGISGASAADTTFTDVTSETSYRTAIVNLSKIGLINGEKLDDGTFVFRPDSSITRAEFTAIIVRALGAGDIAGTADQFTDVSGHWAEGNISVACSRGIIVGFEDATFRPDDEVTYEQAMKMIVCTLGYENSAVAAGGWPNGYMKEGASLGINTGVTNLDQESPAPRGVIAQLIYNALEVEVMDVKISGQADYDKETFMERYLGLSKDKAIIAAVETDVTSFYSTELGKNQLAALIDGNIVFMDFSEYTSNKEDVKKYLGQTVNLFYKTDQVGSDDILIDIDAETTKNTVTTVKYDSLYKCDGSTIQYYDNSDKQKSLKLDSNTSVIYNGSLVTGDVSDKLAGWLTDGSDTFIYGEITATDSGSTGTVDILDITDYEIIVAAKAVSAADYKITNKLKFEKKQYAQIESVTLSPDDTKYEYTITYNNSIIEPTSIKQNDVILYAQSDDTYGEKRKALVSRSPVTGTVTAFSEDDQTITVGGKTYDVHDICLQYFKENSMELKVSASVTLYVDAFNVVVFGEISSSQEVSPYAYIVNAGDSEEDDNKFLTMYSPASNSYKRYTLKDKVSYNGTPVTAAEAVSMLRRQSNLEVDGISINFEDDINRNTTLKSSPYTGTDTSVKTSGDALNAAQIARVTIANNLVTSIVTADYQIGETTEDMSALSKYSNLKNVQYKGSKSFSSQFYYDSNTTVIYIPQDRTASTEYAKKSTSYFATGTSYWVEAYNVNKSKVAGLILVYGSAASSVGVTKTTPISIIGERPSDEDVDGEIKLKLPLYMSTSTLTNKTAADKSEFADSVVGDVVQFGYNSSEEAKGLETRIAMADIQKVLSDAKAALESESHEEIYNWNPGGAVGDLYKKKYNETFYYQTSENYTSEYSYARAFMANVVEVDDSDSTLRITIDGFTWDEEKGEYVLGSDHEERIDIKDTTQFVRYDSEKNKISPYTANTTAAITISDLADARYSGTDCSKILVYMYPGNTCKFICIYE